MLWVLFLGGWSPPNMFFLPGEGLLLVPFTMWRERGGAIDEGDYVLH